MELPTVEEILKNPESFLEREKGNYMPKWKGILLAWIVIELKNPDNLAKIKRIRTHGSEGYKYYKFDPKEFIYHTADEYDRIDELHNIGMDRFELEDGSFYEFVQSDGEYHQDYLSFHGAVSQEVSLEEGFATLLLQYASKSAKERKDREEWRNKRKASFVVNMNETPAKTNKKSKTM